VGKNKGLGPIGGNRKGVSERKREKSLRATRGKDRKKKKNKSIITTKGTRTQVRRWVNDKGQEHKKVGKSEKI